MADISKIIALNGTTYNLKDAAARSDIEDLREAITGGVNFIGRTTTELTDEATTNPITINGKSVTAVAGNLVAYGEKEFLFDGTKWLEMGDIGSLGALAYKNDASGTYTPTGSVSQPTFSGNELTSTGNFTPAGNVTIATGSGTANYTPAGSVSQPSFSGSELTSTGNFTPAGNVTIATGSGTANYTPAGSVAAPTISVKTAGSTTTVNSITNVGTLPTMAMTVENETLTFTFDQGSLPTKGSNTTVKTGDAAYQATAPAFTGTGVQLTGSFSGTQGSVSVKGTPAGTVSKPSFTGTGVQLTGAFSGTQGSVSVKGTPSGTVSKPSFTGTAGTITVE